MKRSKSLKTAAIFFGLNAMLCLLHGGTSARADDSAHSSKDTTEQKNEQKEGQDAATEIAKSAKFVTNKSVLDRVQAIGKRLAAVADKTQVPAGFGNDKVYPFNYTYQVIDEKEINAFSLPGGHIYIYKGLLDLLTTDDEIAGVLGHETAHAAHHHVAMLEHDAAKMSTQLALGTIVAILAHVPPQDAVNLYTGASYAQQAQLNNHYSETAEEDADHTGMIFMQKAGYNPVGMLALLQRLKQVEDLSPDVELGFLRDHPLTSLRLAAARSELADLGVPVNEKSLRQATGTYIARVEDAGGVSDVKLGDRLIFQVSDTNHTEAVDAANKLNSLLDDNLQTYEVKADGATVVARNQPLIQFSDSDLKASGVAADSTPDSLAAQAAKAIQVALWNKTVTSTYEGDNPVAETIHQ